jgi:hypothetical protein
VLDRPADVISQRAGHIGEEQPYTRGSSLSETPEGSPRSSFSTQLRAHPLSQWDGHTQYSLSYALHDLRLCPLLSEVPIMSPCGRSQAPRLARFQDSPSFFSASSCPCPPRFIRNPSAPSPACLCKPVDSGCIHQPPRHIRLRMRSARILI